MALKAAPAEGPPRTRTGRGINHAGATPSSHICQARPSPFAVAAPGARRRQPPPTAAPPPPSRPPLPHVRSAATGPGWAVPCPHHGWHQHQARQRPATVGTTLTPRQDGGTLRPQARLHPGSSDPSPIDADVDSCGIDLRSQRAKQGFKGYGRQPGLANAIYPPWVQRVSGFANWPRGFRRPNAPGGARLGGLDLAGVRFRPGC